MAFYHGKEGTRHTTAHAIVMTAAAKLAVAAAQLARYVDGSLPSEAIGHAGRGSLHSKGTGQMSHSKAATLLTFVTVEAPSVTLYIKHKYKSCTGQVTDAAVQARGVLTGNQIEITLLHVPMTAANIKTPKLELRCSKANSLSLGDQESKQSSEHHDDTPDEEVLCLFAATPDFPKSVICNVDGVTPKFLEIGEQMSVVKEVVEQKFPAFWYIQILINAFVTHITSFGTMEMDI
ncbi:hypothetical protein Tco_0491492 [Tanacetum coccineum]